MADPARCAREGGRPGVAKVDGSFWPLSSAGKGCGFIVGQGASKEVARVGLRAWIVAPEALEQEGVGL